MSDDLTTGATASAPPHDLGAERAVLGHMILNPTGFAYAAQNLTADDFYRPVNGTIFTTLLGMAEKRIDIDPMSVLSELYNNRELIRVGGAPYVSECTAYAVGGARHPVDTVADRAEERRWITHGAKISAISNTPGLTTKERRDQILADHERVTRGRAVSRGRWAAEIIGPAIEHMSNTAEGVTTARTVPTGFRELDRMLGGGLHAGQFVVVAGRPGLGKSTMASDFVRHAALRQSMTSMFVSLEMSDVDLMLRWISAESDIPLAMIRTGALNEREWERVAAMIDRFAENRMIVYDDPGMYMPQIRAEARMARRNHDLRLLVVDYLQLMSDPRRRESRQQEVADLSRGLKLLAKEIECPVVAAAQLNRNPETRADKRPQLSDLRESGTIEQDADVVILLDRPSARGEEAREGEMDFIVAKQRNGPTGTITVADQLHRARFSDMRIV